MIDFLLEVGYYCTGICLEKTIRKSDGRPTKTQRLFNSLLRISGSKGIPAEAVAQVS